MRQYFENGVTVIDTGKKDNVRPPSSGHSNIHKGLRGSWQVRVKRQYVGSFADIEEAVAIRDEAKRQMKAGTFDAWLKEQRRDHTFRLKRK